MAKLCLEAGVELRQLSVGTLRLRYGFRPGPGLPLLLCNGIGANLELTLPLIRALGPRPIVVVDLPGTGGSPDAWFWPSLERYGQMLCEVMRALGLQQAFAVAGVSWGGALAQYLARQYPEQVRALILMATTPGIFMVPGRWPALWRMLTPQRYLSRRYMLRHAGTLYGGELRKGQEALRAHVRLMRPPSVLSYGQQLSAIARFSSLPWLRRISCPSLVLSGEDDPLIHPLNARILAACLPHSSLNLLPQAGHLFMATQPEKTARLLDDFLSRSAERAVSPTGPSQSSARDPDAFLA
ncbi:MAG: alpha/beta fold hydrolase [Oceanococcaceae bacterium]